MLFRKVFLFLVFVSAIYITFRLSDVGLCLKFSFDIVSPFSPPFLPSGEWMSSGPSFLHVDLASAWKRDLTKNTGKKVSLVG